MDNDQPSDAGNGHAAVPVVLADPTPLPASQFRLPVANDANGDPLSDAELLAPWPLLRVIQRDGMSAIVATRALPRGASIARFYGSVHAAPTTYTLQVGDGVHVTCTEGGPAFTNHSCDPNAFFDMSHCSDLSPFPVLTALRDIAPGEEVTFHYCHNEWAMAVPFECLCGAQQCLGKIQGFSALDDNTKRAFEPYLAPFIAARWREQQKQQAQTPL